MMEKLNCFINYEIIDFKTYGREEKAVYLIEMHNGEKVEHFLHECDVMRTLNKRPFTMEEVFNKLLVYYTFYVTFDRSFSNFVNNNNLRCDQSKENTLWSKATMIGKKLERLFGKDLVYFIVSYFDADLCFGLATKFENMIECEILDFLIEDLEKQYGRIDFE